MSQINQKEVAVKNKRNYAYYITKLWLRKGVMSKQAKTLNLEELQKVLDFVAKGKHAARNRAIVQTQFNTGMRVGETASLKYSDVVDAKGLVRKEIRLRAEQTKTREARVVFVNERLQKELQAYVDIYKPSNPSAKLFYSQKSSTKGFTANTLTQFWHYLYKNIGLEGASSHSSRRTFITNLASKGVGVRVIMGLSGHRALSSVQCYIDCNDDMKRRAVELV